MRGGFLRGGVRGQERERNAGAKARFDGRQGMVDVHGSSALAVFGKL